MTRKEAKEMLPIIQAYAEGKTIQFLDGGKWLDMYETDFHKSTYKYRIKPEPKYRPFNSIEECWKEMLKHQPFGWIKNKNGYWFISSIHKFIEKTKTFECYTFADGTPFGIKKE